VLFVDKIEIDGAKTKKAKDVLSSLSSVSGFEELSTKKKNAIYLTLAEKSETTERGFKNFGNVKLDTVENLNLLGVLNNKYLIITGPEKTIGVIENRIKKTA